MDKLIYCDQFSKEIKDEFKLMIAVSKKEFVKLDCKAIHQVKKCKTVDLNFNYKCKSLM